MKEIFKATYDLLIWLSDLTGFSYKEINIIIWFIIIPLSWAILIDKIRNKHYLKTLTILFITITLIFIKDFSKFSNWLFDKSADFLRGFDSFGMNYTIASVVICVFIPILIYGVLIKKAYFNKKSNY